MASDAKACPVCGLRYDAAAVFCQRDGTRLAALPTHPAGLADRDPDGLIGQVLLGQFRLDEALGAGGMGTVYRARQAGVDRDVAIKILHGDVAQDPEAARRFEREARVSAQIDHPNVVRVLLFGRLPDGRCYLVMEYLEGPSLAELLEDAGGPLPLRVALAISAGIADGLGAAHRGGVVHRDIKPENVVLVGGDPARVKILDFGVARCLWGEHTMATEAGLVFGTARYISPEGASGDATDARSDVYSLGVLTHQMLAGRPPFDADAPVALLLRHVQDPAPPLPLAIPRPVREAVASSLEKAPDRRPRDGDAFAERIRGAAADVGVTVAAAPGDRVSRPSVGGAPPSPHAAAPTLLESRRGVLVDPAGDAYDDGVVGPMPSFGPDRPSVPATPTTWTGAPPVLPRPAPRAPGLGGAGVVGLAFVLGAVAVLAGAAHFGFFEGMAGTPVAPPAVTGVPAAAPAPAPPEVVAGVHVEPRRPVAGQPATLVAVVARDLPLAEPVDATFRLFRRGRTQGTPIEASRVPGGGFVASTRFRRAGVHRVEFQVRVAGGAGDTRERLSLSVDVEVAPPEPAVASRPGRRTVTNALPNRAPSPSPRNVTREDPSPSEGGPRPLPGFPFEEGDARESPPNGNAPMPTPTLPPGAELL